MTAVRNVWALVQKEWRHYFASPIAYVTLAAWCLLFGIFFNMMVGFFLEYSMQSMSRGGMGAPPISLNEIVIAQVLRQMAVVALFVTPMITMRLFAEEKRTGTIELLATSPVTDLQIVLGKFFAALGLYVVMILAGMLNFALLWAYATSKPEWKPLATGALGLLLLGASFIALGLFISSLTRNQIVAGILSFCLFLGIWVLGWLDDPMSGTAMKAISYLGLTTHLEDLTKGIVDLKDVVYYLSVITFGVFLTQQSVESQRWRA
jgi:ABC-2 type transport system permease protein